MGHIIFFPLITVGDATEQHIQDVAVIEIDASKIDPNTFTGNVIDLDSRFGPGELTLMMHPTPRTPTTSTTRATAS